MIPLRYCANTNARNIKGSRSPLFQGIPPPYSGIVFVLIISERTEFRLLYSVTRSCRAAMSPQPDFATVRNLIYYCYRPLSQLFVSRYSCSTLERAVFKLILTLIQSHFIYLHLVLISPVLYIINFIFILTISHSTDINC